MTRLGQEFGSVTKMLLDGAPGGMKPTKPTALRWRAFQNGDLPRLLLANPTYDQTITVSFKLPPPPSPEHFWNGPLIFGDEFNVWLATCRGHTYLRMAVPPTTCFLLAMMTTISCG